MTFAIATQLNENFIKKRFIKIFFCLFSNFCGSKPTRTQTQNREKQRNGLIRYSRHNYNHCGSQAT
jgi:hypothetical protein